MEIVNRKSTGALTWICTTSLRLRRAACRTDYTLRALKPSRVERRRSKARVTVRCFRRSTFVLRPIMVSVIGLAPIRPGLKDRLLELLCIHGRLAKLVPEVGIAPTSPPLQGGALICLSYSGVNVVVPHGNAPRSLAYQASALLLSYETMAEGVGPPFAKQTSKDLGN